MALSDTEKDAVLRVSARRIYRDIEQLCSFGPRHIGSTGEALSHRYLEAQVAELGGRSERMPFEIAVAHSVTGHLRLLAPSEEAIECEVNYRSAATPPNGLDADRVVDVGFGVESDYSGRDVSGAVVLATEGGMHPVPKVELAAERGATACIWASSHAGNLISTFGLPRFGSPIPVLSISRERGEFLREHLRRGPIRLKLTVRTDLQRGTGCHVVGILEGKSRPSERVILCAHNETVPNTVGADDNASGVAIILEVMRALSSVRPNRTLWGVFSSGEEGGAPGMRAYVAEHEMEIRRHTTAFFCLDTLGYGTRLCRITEGLWPDRKVFTSDRLNELLKASAEDLGYELFDRVSKLGLADAEPFADAGVPTAWLRNRDNLPLHTSADTPDRIDPNGLKIPAEVLLLALLRLDEQANVAG